MPDYPPNPLPCGCRAVMPDDYGAPRPKMPVIYVAHCPPHAAASNAQAALVAACQAALQWNESNVDAAMSHHESCPPCFGKDLTKQLQAALALSKET